MTTGLDNRVRPPSLPSVRAISSVCISKSNFNLRFPATWPVFIPAKKVQRGHIKRVFTLICHFKLGNWLEYYAEAMELNVWTSTTVTSALLNDNSHLWSVTVRRQDGSERVFTVKHVVFAMGFKGGDGYIPTYPGMVQYPIAS